MSVYNFANTVVAGAAGQSTGFYPVSIDQSLRFNDDDSAYLSRTPTGTSGGRTKFTYSGWVKISALSTADGFHLLNAPYASNLNGSLLMIDSNNEFYAQFRVYTTGSQGAFDAECYSNMKFRDPSAWYHIVFTYDSTAAETSRMKLWVNGVSQSFRSVDWPASSTAQYIGSEFAHQIGRWLGSSHGNTDGYMAEVHFTDGTAYDADAFGELKSGVWVAKSPSVTYGTNGFYLDFANSADIGNDVSGEGNDWTVNNLVASDVVPDSPTNNFCTLNSVNKESVAVFAEGNLKYNQTTNVLDTSFATMGMPPNSGKWYWEVYVLGGNRGTLGLSDTEQNTTLDQPGGTGDLGLGLTGEINNVYVGEDNPPQTASDSFTTGDYVNICYDSDNGKMWFGINGTWVDSGDPDTDSNEAPKALSSVTFVPSASAYLSTFIFNFGQDSTFAGTNAAGGNSDANGIGDFKYTVPANAKALCTSNLPDPAIDPAQDASPEDYFNTVLYDGTSTTNSVTGVGFQPDFVWLKNRSTDIAHAMFDVLRGTSAAGTTNTAIGSNRADAEGNGNGVLSSFNADGFTVDSGSSGSFPDTLVNVSPDNYVAWNWNAGGSTTSGTATGGGGSRSYSYRASQDSGFSIVIWTGDGTDAGQVPHGLTGSVDAAFVKTRNSSVDWHCFFKSGLLTGEGYFLSLNKTDGEGTTSYGRADLNDSSTELTLHAGGNGLRNVNNSGTTYVAYVFKSVEGFSKVGSYTGDQSSDSDSNFVYLGFRPAFVMIKGTSANSPWLMFDSTRKAYNVIGDEALGANYSEPEGLSSWNPNTSNSVIDLLSNGFKIRTQSTTGINSSGTHIYMAFAENPFKYSNAR